jgi:hypothetical protein
MITKKLVIIFLLIIAIIIILLIKHNQKNTDSNMFNIEHFNLYLTVQEENEYNNIVTTYYDNNTDYTSNIINKFGIINTKDINIQEDLNLTNNNNTFNNIKTGDVNTTTLNSKLANINTVNTSQNIVNTTDNYNKFTKLNINDISSNTIVNSNNTKFNNVSISDNLNIANKNFNDSIMYVNQLCFDNNCIDKSIFNNINKIDTIKEQYSSPLFQYMYLPNSRNANGTIINDNNLIWKDIKNEITPDNNADGRLKAVISRWNMDYNTYNWNGKCIYKTTYYGNYSDNGQGIEIRVPEHPNKAKGEDYTVLWVQTLGERWSTFRVYELDASAPSRQRGIADTDTQYFKKYFHKHVAGYSNLNKISPDGSTHNEQWNLFEWTPVPIDLSGNTQRKLIIGHMFKGNGDSWFSGFAFSTNPWNHYKCSALELHWLVHNSNDNQNLNGATSGGNIIMGGDWWNWNNEPLARFNDNGWIQFRIPFVHSGKDKIFYLVEHNNNWGPSNIRLDIQKNVNNISTYINLGNLYTSFNNPFATHFNSKIYQRYYGIRIPKEHLPPKDPMCNDFITLVIVLPSTNNGIHFREVGTHDESPF